MLSSFTQNTLNLKTNKAKDEFNINSFIVNNKNKKWLIPKTQIILSNNSSYTNNEILYENKIDTVKILGNLIKKIGDFQKLLSSWHFKSKIKSKLFNRCRRDLFYKT